MPTLNLKLPIVSFEDPDQSLPDALRTKINEAGFAECHEDDWLAPFLFGGEKNVYEAVDCRNDTEGFGVVVLHSQWDAEMRKWRWNHQREKEIFTDLAGADRKGESCDHIIKMLASFDAAPGHGPCMVVERVNPVGFDMKHLYNQFQHAHGRTLPLVQWSYYLKQLLNAVRHLHEHKWVHCDLKLENVLIQEDQVVKLIDFGCARRAGVELPPPGRPDAHMPPEFSKDDILVQTSADMWLLGTMMLTLFAQEAIEYKWQSQRIQIDGVQAYLHKCCVGKDLDPVVQEAIGKLMMSCPEERWTVTDLMEWLQQSVPLTPRRPRVEVESSESQRCPISKNIQKVKKMDRIVKAYGLEMRQSSQFSTFIGKHVGPQGVDLRRQFGATLLFIDRCDESVIMVPDADVQIQCNDWLYVKLEQGTTPGTDAWQNFQEALTGSRECSRGAVEIILEFDEFQFPSHCFGCRVGPGCEGQNGLDLRKKFRIGLAFISRLSGDRRVFMEILPDTVIQPGDRGVFGRVPDRRTGRSKPILTEQDLEPLCSEDLFRNRMGLNDAAWEEWLSNTNRHKVSL